MSKIFSSVLAFVFALVATVSIITFVTTTTPVSAVPPSFLPPIIDWRAKGVVGPTQNQGQVNDAALIATLGNIQSVSAITNGNKFVALSEAELLTCASGRGSSFAEHYYRWIMDEAKGTLAPNSTHAWTPALCRDPASSQPVGARVTKIIRLQRSELEIHAALRAGPVFVVIDAQPLETYTKGTVTQQCQAKEVDDAALVVGVNTTATPPFWTLQMSWGPNFGNDGFVNIEYGTDCLGISFLPTTVIAAKLD